MYDALLSQAKNFFSINDEFLRFFSPGRVNLIGEHIDYNGGYVLPFGIKQGTYLLIRQNKFKYHRFLSLNFETDKIISLPVTCFERQNSWIDYPLGVIKEFHDRQIEIPGLDLLFYGDIPLGSGLSSSASIEMVTANAINEILNVNFDKLEFVHICKSCENNFIKVNTGIMDQFTVGFQKPNNLILLNCNTLNFSYVPFAPQNVSVVIINTNKPRNLIYSKYDERYAECQEILNIINRKTNNNYDYLCDIQYNDMDYFLNIIPDDSLKRRFIHVLSENKRVTDAVNAINNNDLINLGKLLFESHHSLKNNYEVTGTELDTIVENSLIDGVYGARMTGGGFGGCAIALIENKYINQYIQHISQIFKQKIGYCPTFL